MCTVLGVIPSNTTHSLTLGKRMRKKASERQTKCYSTAKLSAVEHLSTAVDKLLYEPETYFRNDLH